MKLWRPNDFKLRTIQDKQLQILRSQGPVLSAFRSSSPNPNPFLRVKPKPWPNCTQELALRSDDRSNLRAFYYMLLATCFSKRERSAVLLTNFKKFVYSEATILDEFGRQFVAEGVGAAERALTSNSAMKRLIAEFLQLLSHQLDLCTLLQTYPILDPILLSVLHSLVLTHHYSATLLRISTAIPTQLIISSLQAQFGTRIEPTFNEIVFEEYMSLRQDKEFTIMRTNSESVLESTRSGILGLGDISAIEERREEGNSEGVGDRKEGGTTGGNALQTGESSPRREILKCLSTIRRCDSLFGHTNNAGEDVKSQESGDQRQKTDRHKRKEDKDGKPMMPGLKLKQVNSQMDSSSNDSNGSCVIYKVSFNKNQQTSPLPSPRNPKPRNKLLLPNPKQPSPRHRQPQLQSQQSPSPELFPVIQVKKAEQSKISSSSELCVSGKLDTIQSVEDSCVEESMMAEVDQELVKNHLCDGTTSQAVLKLLSPLLANNLKQKKEQSLKTIMEKYSTVSSTNLSMKSCYDAGSRLRQTELPKKLNNIIANLSINNLDVFDKKPGNLTAANRSSHTLQFKQTSFQHQKLLTVPSSLSNSPRGSIVSQERPSFGPPAFSKQNKGAPAPGLLAKLQKKSMMIPRETLHLETRYGQQQEGSGGGSKGSSYK